MNWNLNKYWKKSNFLSQKLIFPCLKKNFLKKVDFFYFRSYERSELPVHLSLERFFFPSSEKLIFEKENVIF